MVLVDSWRLASTISIASPTRNSLPIALSYPFKARLLRTETIIAGTPARWKLAGYLNQILPNNDETVSLFVALNSRKLHALPLLMPDYKFVFTPVAWLPAGLRLRVWEYTGPPPDEALMKEILFLQRR